MRTGADKPATASPGCRINTNVDTAKSVAPPAGSTNTAGVKHAPAADKTRFVVKTTIAYQVGVNYLVMLLLLQLVPPQTLLL